MRKICAITANRADFSRIESILSATKEHSDLELQLIVMGSHLIEEKGKTIDEIIKKGFKPDKIIEMEEKGGDLVAMTKSVGLAITELAPVLNELNPDIVIAPVDRFESLAMGVTPALMNIHVAHIQGGEVTGTIDESIRHALTKMAHLHFVATKESRDRVIKMGEPENTVFNVGCPATDLLFSAPEYNTKETLEKLTQLDSSQPYIFMVQHPVTTEFGKSEQQIKATLDAIKDIGMQSIVLWPNIDAGSDAITSVIKEYSESLENMYVFAHIPTELFVNVLRNASCQVGNSSSGIREACYFGTPVVNVGSRQNSRERGNNVVDVASDSEKIQKSINEQIKHGPYPIEKIYGDGIAGKQIADILATIKLPSIQKKITY